MTDGDGKRDRNPWADRYDRDDDDQDDPGIESEASSETAEMSEAPNISNTSKRQKTTKTSKSKKTAESEESSGTVRERKNVNMYLPESLVDDLQMRYSELNVEWRRRRVALQF